MNKVKILYQQISKTLLNNIDEKQIKKDKIYHKYPHKSLGITAPKLNKILRNFNKDIRQLNCRESLSLSNFLAKRKIEEFVSAAIYVLESHLDCLVTHLAFINQFSRYMVSWSTVDDFCIKILQPLLKRKPKTILQLVKKWNKSPDLWSRRASLVVFTRGIGESGQFTEIILKLCDNLIWDREDLVQKAVGWVLKDAMRGDKVKVLNYVKALRKKGVPSTITLYAIRDLKGHERSKVLKIKP